MAQIAIFSAILLIQKELLAILPNIQLSVFFVLIFSKYLGIKKTSLILLIYTIVDNLIFGMFNPLFWCFQYVAWLILPIIICTIFKKIENNWILGVISAVYAIIYSWILIIHNLIIYQVNFAAYLISDLPFEGILCASSFLSVSLLYKPISKIFNKYKFNKNDFE